MHYFFKNLMRERCDTNIVEDTPNYDISFFFLVWLEDFAAGYGAMGLWCPSNFGALCGGTLRTCSGRLWFF